MAVQTTPGGNLYDTVNGVKQDEDTALNRDARDLAVADRTATRILEDPDFVKGITGPAGPAPDIYAGTTTQVDAGTPASVDVVETGEGVYRADFTIPKGADGDGAGMDDASVASHINTVGSDTRTALKAQIGYGAVEAVGGRMVFTEDPTIDVPDGTLIAHYQGPRTMFEQFTDGLIGLTPRWKDRSAWQGSGGNVTLPETPEFSGTRRRAISFDQVGTRERSVQVLYEFTRAGTFSAMHCGVVLRGRTEANGSETGITVGVSSNNLVVWTFKAGAAVNAASIPVTVPVDVPHRCRVEIDEAENRLRARVWPVGSTEPATWNINTIVSAITEPGWVGLASSTANHSITQIWHWASVGTQGNQALIP